jgi:hypothetical protein
LRSISSAGPWTMSADWSLRMLHMLWKSRFLATHPREAAFSL